MATFRPSTEQWRPLVARMAGDLPVDFLMAFIDEESGGNVCSLGIPGVEAGLFQTFHPSDDRQGATFSQLRTACSGSSLVRELTSDEAQLQVQVGMNKVRELRERARATLRAVGATWLEASTDFWKWVKLGHGLPAMQADLMRQISGSLGRAPRTWDEYKDLVLSLPANSFPQSLIGFSNAASTRGRQNRIADVIANAEQAGQFGGLGSMTTGAALIAVAAAGLVLVYLWRRRKRAR